MKQKLQHNLARAAILVSGILCAGSAAAQAPAAKPLPMASKQMLASNCTGCHGTDGVSKGPAAPSIAGAMKETFVEIMQAYKSGERHSTVMGRIAKGYSDAEIEAMADYFAGKKYVPQAQKTDSAKVAHGRKIATDKCEKCHEDNGHSNKDTAILAGQWMPYLTFQMADYTNGKSPMPKKMDKAVEKLSPADIEAVIHYYGSQK